MEAPPLIRYVRVSEQWDPGCDSVTISGRSAGLRHEDRMGEFALQYERCEGAEVVGESTADGPSGRCVQTTIDGYPVYKQVKGDNWLYYYEPTRMWVVDTEFTCAIKCTPLFSMKVRRSIAIARFRTACLAHLRTHMCLAPSSRRLTYEGRGESRARGTARRL